MNQHSGAQFKPMYYLQRPTNSKNQLNQVHSAKNLSLTMSIGANQNLNNFLPLNFPKPETPQQRSSEQYLPVAPEYSEKQDS